MHTTIDVTAISTADTIRPLAKRVLDAVNSVPMQKRQAIFWRVVLGMQLAWLGALVLASACPSLAG